MKILQNIFEIGNGVYHNTPDSDLGVVLDCRYSLRHREWEYLVSFGSDKESMWYYEDELREDKLF